MRAIFCKRPLCRLLKDYFSLFDKKNPSPHLNPIIDARHKRGIILDRQTTIDRTKINPLPQPTVIENKVKLSSNETSTSCETTPCGLISSLCFVRVSFSYRALVWLPRCCSWKPSSSSSSSVVVVARCASQFPTALFA